jgi:hypothetical protein
MCFELVLNSIQQLLTVALMRMSSMCNPPANINVVQRQQMIDA